MREEDAGFWRRAAWLIGDIVEPIWALRWVIVTIIAIVAAGLAD